MAIVKFLSKSGLSDHGDNATVSSGIYRDALEGAHHTLNIKSSGSHSEAIEAFETKLNNIAQQVFVKYPELLTKYGTAIATYTSAVEGAGFTSDTLRTQKTPIKNLKRWLDHTTVDEFEKLHKTLDPKLEIAKAALALDPDPVSVGEDEVNTRSELSSVKDKLQTLGQERMDTHMSLENALQSFKAELKGIASELGQTITALSNARFMTSLSASDVAQLIASGSLRADNIDELDNIQGSGDGAALKVLLSEGADKQSFFAAIGEIDTEHVSSTMMYKIYARTHLEELLAEETKDFSNIETMIIAISNQDYGKARIYSRKMAIAADQHALILADRARLLNLKLKGNDAQSVSAYKQEMEKNQEIIQALDHEIRVSGRLAHLFESMYVNHMGENRRITASNKHTIHETKTIRKESLTFNSANDTFRYKVDTKLDGQLIVSREMDISSLRKETEAGTELSYLAKEYQDLDRKRMAAVGEFVLDVATLGAGSKYSSMIQSFRNSAAIFGSDSSTAARIQGIGRQDGVFKSVFGESYSKFVDKWPKGLTDTGSFFAKLSSIEGEGERIKRELKQEAFDIGGYVIQDHNDPKNRSVLYRPQYDLQAILQMDDLNKNGLRTYIAESKGHEALQSFDRAMAHYQPVTDGSTRAALTAEVRDVLAGKGGLYDQNLVHVFEGVKAVQDYTFDVENSRLGKGFFGLDGYNFNVEEYTENRKTYFKKLLAGGGQR